VALCASGADEGYDLMNDHAAAVIAQRGIGDLIGIPDADGSHVISAWLREHEIDFSFSEIESIADLLTSGHGSIDPRGLVR
jgi:hypothetical protein